MGDLRRQLFAALSVLLQYPDASTHKVMPQVRALASALDAESERELSAFVNWFESVSLLEAQAHYVELFDRKRRACLYLSYYLNGDTRRRGMALVRFKELYREFGWEAADGELPDFLPTLLQFAAVGADDVATDVMEAHRAGLVVLQKALLDAKSSYAHLATALLTVVPVNSEHGRAVLHLIESGPPSELVGLEPFSAPERIGV